MTEQEIFHHVDLTLLRPDATREEILRLAGEGMERQAASICIPPFFVREAAAYCANRLPVCTVIGFPNGYATDRVKCFEAADAVKNGAREIDMVIAVGLLRGGQDEALLRQINEVKSACGEAILKVIVETCLLTKEEKARVLSIVDASDAEFIKTSTGFGSGGAVLEDVIQWKKAIRHGTKIKAAGGIRSFSSAEAFLIAGADRIGASRLRRDA